MGNPETTPVKKTTRFSFAGYFAGPLLGLAVGAAAGKGGSLIGALLGFLLQQLIRRYSASRKVARYFEEPGKVDFNEGLPGLAAYCALGIALVSLSVRAAEPSRLFPGSFPRQPAGEGRGAARGKKQDGELIARRVVQSALEAFPGSSSELALMEGFCRIALSMTDRLNPDLLVESLAARRYGAGDLERLGQQLETLAEGDRALQEAASLRRILEPFSQKKI